MAGFDIYLRGSDTEGAGTVPTDYTKFRVLGLDRENDFKEAGKEGTHGGYRSPIGMRRSFTLNFEAIPALDYEVWLDDLFDILTSPYVYFNRGTHFTTLTGEFSAVRIVAMGGSAEHNYNDGTKSVDIPVVVYE